MKSIRRLKSKLRTHIEFEPLYINQDTSQVFHMLSHDVQLNVEMDLMAK